MRPSKMFQKYRDGFRGKPMDLGYEPFGCCLSINQSTLTFEVWKKKTLQRDDRKMGKKNSLKILTSSRLQKEPSTASQFTEWYFWKMISGSSCTLLLNSEEKKLGTFEFFLQIFQPSNVWKKKLRSPRNPSSQNSMPCRSCGSTASKPREFLDGALALGLSRVCCEVNT